MDQEISWSWKRALLIMGIMTFLCSGSSIAAFFWWKQQQEARRADPRYAITELVCHCYRGQELPKDYLQALLGLSKEKPGNLFDFSLQEGINHLLASPWIASAELVKVPPGTLVLQYAVREPLAALGDFSGALVDEEGIIFPQEPFFSHRRFVVVYLGWKSRVAWGDPISNPKLVAAYHLLALLDRHSLPVESIDMTHTNDLSYGQREVIVYLREPEKVKLRLFPGNLQALNDYHVLRKQKLFHQERATEVDMRLPDLAYIKLL